MLLGLLFPRKGWSFRRGKESGQVQSSQMGERAQEHRQRDGCQQGGPDGGFGGRERGFNREAFREVEGLVRGG